MAQIEPFLPICPDTFGAVKHKTDMDEEKREETQQPELTAEEQAGQAAEPETTVETPAEPAQETAAPATANERLRKRYPDENPESDEDWEKLRNRYMDDLEASEKDHAAFEKEVDELIASDTDLAIVLNRMLVDKMPFRAALASALDTADLKPQEGEEDYEAYSKAYDERVKHNQAMVERQKEIDANAEKSFENIDAFCTQKGYDDKTKDGIVDFINEVFDAIVMKNISPELLEKLDKARTFDSAVRDAELKGEVKGRNANIEAQRVEEMEKEEGDGIPVPRATGGSPLQPKEAPKKTDIMQSFMGGIGENKWMNNR